MSISEWAHSSETVSSSCGWKTFTRKSSRNDVRVLFAISESIGTISFSRWRKEREGGKSRLMLKTLGSTSNLCPAAGPSTVKLSMLLPTPGRRTDFETSPGTEA